MDEYDGPWKEALEAALPECLELLYPALWAIIDWGLDHESLDAELPKLQPEAAGGANRADRLVKASRKGTGDERFVHVEAQMTPEDGFGLRMFRYGYRGRDRWGRPLLALAILGDADPAWRPSGHREGELESETVYRFKAVKLLDLRPRLAELEAGANLFGLFVAAHLQTLASRKDAEARATAKLRLMRNLLGRGLPALEEGTWARILDWLMKLPDEYNQALWDELRESKGEGMRYITPFERYAMEDGLARGMKDGLAKGMEDGLAKGLEKGMEKGRASAFQDLLRLKLGAKFAAGGAALAERVEMPDAAALAAALDAIAAADTLEQARAALGLDP